MIYNYHTHTKRCSHATGEAEEYIQNAISGGIRHMGFSEHAPFLRPDGTETYYRLPMSQVEDYFSEIRSLRGKYKEEINLAIGFEMEYYPKSFDIMLANAKKFGAEYLILGQHFLNEEYSDGIYTGQETRNKAKLKTYVSRIVKAIKSGVFTYVAHPDIIRFTGSREVYDEEIRKICVASAMYNVPLEINFLGIRQGRAYPNEAFWKIAGEEKSPVTFGFDAHAAKDAFDDASLKRAKEIVDKYNLNYVGMPKLVLIQDL